MRILLLALLVAVTVGTSTVVWAKSRWYQVEVIVFNHAHASSAVGEQWPDLEALPDFRDAINLFVDRPHDSSESSDGRPNEVAIPGPLAFQLLPANKLKLSGVYRRLRNSSAYTPILHVGWRQPGLSGSRASSVYISDKERIATDKRIATDIDRSPMQFVEGQIQIRTGRLLYVVADFVKYGGDAPVRITEQRQVKFKEIHYFDHPLFGVIVQVTPYRIAAPAGVVDAE